jgi:mRNA interferase HicA
MKRRDPIKHQTRHGCSKSREGGRHTVFVNATADRSTTIPRHREVNEFLARKI